MTPNRLVALLTPLVFAPLAGSISALAAEYFPFIDVPSGALEEIFIAGALIAFAKAAQWTQGWQKYEAREATRAEAAERLDAREAAISARERELAAYDVEPAAPYDESPEGLYDDDVTGGYEEWLPADPELDGEDAESFEEPAAVRAER
jgi:hypothetical protein